MPDVRGVRSPYYGPGCNVRIRLSLDGGNTWQPIAQVNDGKPIRATVWELRDNLTVYDAWYVALAEWLGVEFITADERLAGASGLRCAVRHLGGGQGDPGSFS